MVRNGVDMRVISQDRLINVPFDLCVFTRIEGIIRAKYGNDVYVLAEFEDPEVAAAEMERLQYASINNKIGLPPAKFEFKGEQSE